MYSTNEIPIEIRLINQDGAIVVYTDYTTFINSVDYWFAKKHILTTFSERPSEWLVSFMCKETPIYYIVRDKFGSVFSKNEILNDIKKKNKTNSVLNKWFSKKHDFVYRETPVPRTGKSNWRFNNFYKRPKYAHERRWNIAHIEYVRGKRHPAYLPDPWDDVVRSDIRERKNWKCRRKTQWKDASVA